MDGCVGGRGARSRCYCVLEGTRGGRVGGGGVVGFLEKRDLVHPAGALRLGYKGRGRTGGRGGGSCWLFLCFGGDRGRAVGGGGGLTGLLRSVI